MRDEVGAAKACDGGCRALQSTQHGLFHAVEEVDWLDGLAIGPAWAGQLVERSGAGGEVVERGQMSEIAPVASEQDVLQVPETVHPDPTLFDADQFLAQQERK